MPYWKPDCACALQRKAGTVTTSLPGSPFSAVRFEDEYCAIRACFANFGVRIGGISLQLRLAGGARSLALTLLRLNSLLTGKITGNLRNFGLQNRTASL